MMAVTSSCKDKFGMDSGKYVRYTPEQVEALERLYHECPKPSSLRRQQLIRECPILSNIEPKQIKVWFQNRRCREKQRKESSRLQGVNRKLTAMNKLLMEENDRLQKQVSQLVYENSFFRQQTQTAALATTDNNSCESVVTSGQHNLTPQRPPRDASPAGLLSLAEETLTEFLSKATGTAVEWVQMPGMKPGPDSIGIIAISHGCSGVASRACGLVGLEPTRVAEILKDRPSWFRDCRAVDVLNVMSTGNGGTIELLYMQLYAPTTLAPARDFWLMRYTSVMEDGSLVICERSLNNTQNGPSMPPVQSFVRADILPSGYLIRPCEGGGSIIHIVDHMDLEPWSVPEVLRPLYESSTLLSQRTTMAALRHLRQISQEISHPTVSGWGRRPAALRALGQRLSKGFNEAVNGFTDEGWSMLESDGVDDVTILVNSSPSKLMGANISYANGFPSMSSAVLCAKASMLLQNVPPPILLRFLREHRSEWADSGIDAYSAAAVKAGPCSIPVTRTGSFGGQIILPLAHTIEHEEFMEVIRLESIGHYQDDMIMPSDIFLLQLCNGVDENAIGTCAELMFAPIDASFADDAPLLPSGFRIIPLDSKADASSPNRTLDLASTLEVGPAGSRPTGDHSKNSGSAKSVMTIAFQFAFEIHLQESIAAMARQYVRSIISSVQRVALALSPSRIGSLPGLRSPPGTPEAQTLARWICQSYRFFLGVELLKSASGGSESILKEIWDHSDALMCCSMKALPVFTFANEAGLDMLETTLVALQDISLEKIFDDNGRKALYSAHIYKSTKFLQKFHFLMAESKLELKSPPNPNSLIVSAQPSSPPESPPVTSGGGFVPAAWFRQRPKLRVTTEFDSDSSVFFHRISCKVLDSLAKLKFSFQNNGKGEISDPQLALTSKYLSLHYDIEEKNALVNASFDVAPGLQFKAVHEVKSQQGELAMVADLAGPAYKFELSSAVPAIGKPRATIRFPLGEVSLEEKEEEEEEQAKRILSVNGILKGQILNGVCTAKYKDEALDLRYCFKDEQMTFIPSISLPSNAMSFAFKRRFGPSDKLSYWYNLDTNYWSTVYKHNIGKDYKFKAGYDSEVRLGWASLWVGEESGKAKTAPMKMKVQFMLQVPQDDITSSTLMFRAKKRWDI